MAQLEIILADTPTEPPCGPDLFEDQGLDGPLYALVDDGMGRRKASAVEGERKESGPASGRASWQRLEEYTVDFLKATKHLKLAWFYLMSQAHLRGLAGLIDGLDLLTFLVDRRWAEVHPRDTSDDFAERREILVKAASPDLLEALDKVVLTSVRLGLTKEGLMLGSFTLGEVLSSEGEGDPSPETVRQSFAQTVLEQQDYYDKLAAELKSAQEAVDRLVQATAEATEGKCKLQLKPLHDKLAQIGRAIAGYAEVPASLLGGDEGEETVAGGAGGGGAAARGPSGSDSLQTRDDVVRLLDRIIQFYQKFEPTSPVPDLLDRTKRVVHMDFRQIVKEFGLSGTPPISEVLGWREENP